jgi:hypothetical protein
VFSAAALAATYRQPRPVTQSQRQLQQFNTLFMPVLGKNNQIIENAV